MATVGRRIQGNQEEARKIEGLEEPASLDYLAHPPSTDTVNRPEELCHLDIQMLGYRKSWVFRCLDIGIQH